MLVHICCSVDSHYFLTKLKSDYPLEEIVGYFYNPNIHPIEEYDLRLQDVQKSCEKLNIKLINGEYDDNSWFDFVKGFENEPEKGKRCEVCFDMRFVKTAILAKQLGHKTYTSTLLQSPLKSQDSILNSAKFASNEYGVEFVFVDYRSKGGMNEQNLAAKNESLYRQNYCGCIYGLDMQRKKQNRFAYELISDINAKPLPSSAANRLDNFNTETKILNTNILNYRILRAYIVVNNQVVDSAILAYSKSLKESWSDKAQYIKDGVMFFEKQNAKIITICKYNELAKIEHKALKDLQNSSFLKDLLVKSQISKIDAIDISPIFVVNELPNIDKEITFYLSSTIDEDKEWFNLG